MSLIVIETTCRTENEASDISKALVEMKLAVCCHVVSNVRSFFFWEGRLEEEKESLLRIKTSLSLKQAVYDFLLAHHSYEIPECICFTCDASAAYQEWIDHELH